MMIHFLRRDVLDSTDRELIIAVFLSNFTNRPSGQGPAEAHAGGKAAHMKWRPDGALRVVVVDNGTHRGEHVGTDRRMAKRS